MSAFNTKCSWTNPRAERDLGPGWLIWLAPPPRAPLRDPWVRRQAAPVPHLSPGRKVQKTSDLPAPEYRDVAGGGGSMEGWGWSPADLSFFPFLERSS